MVWLVLAWPGGVCQGQQIFGNVARPPAGPVMGTYHHCINFGMMDIVWLDLHPGARPVVCPPRRTQALHHNPLFLYKQYQFCGLESPATDIGSQGDTIGQLKTAGARLEPSGVLKVHLYTPSQVLVVFRDEMESWVQMKRDLEGDGCL